MRYLGFVKFTLLILAVAAPIGFYQAWRTHRSLLLSNQDLRRKMVDERDALLKQVALRHFSELTEQATLKRSLPHGPIEGLPPFPGLDPLVGHAGIRLEEQTSARALFLSLLHSNEVFASGMPKRYAGLIELLAGGEAVLGPADSDRFHEVSQDFWLGVDLDSETHGFLLEKVPDEPCAVFNAQQRFLGVSSAAAAGGFLIRLRKDDTLYLLELPKKQLAQFNRTVKSLAPEVTFVLSDAWLDWGDIQLTLKPQFSGASAPLTRRALIYLGLAMTTELILLLIFLVLRKYETINRAQRQLLAATSHELRTPLAVIRQFAEMLVNKQANFPERVRGYHNFIHQESLKMQFLVENLLSAARFEFLREKITVTSFDLKAFLEEIADSVHNLDTAHEITVACPEIKVHWDRTLISQAVTNILENARVHAGTKIEVIATVHDDAIRVRIRDYGTSPNLEKLRSIKAFGPGQTSKKGLGLGLYLTKKILDSHHGRLSFEAAEPGLAVMLQIPQDAGGQDAE